jgi:hypothetical protein
MAFKNLPPPPAVNQVLDTRQWKDWFYTIFQNVNTNNGNLGTMATQNANDVVITGGSIENLNPPLAIISGGTGANNATQARINLGIVGGNSEYQTATAGQTVFYIVSFTYTVGSKTLMVFVNGSKQINTINYNETNSTTVTFVNGLNVGDLVEFVL